MNPTSFPAAPDSPAAMAALARAGDRFGFVPNLARVIAHSPPALDAYLAGLDTFAHSSLAPAERELALVVAGVGNRCAYSVAVHSALATAAGLPGPALDAARAGRPIASEPRLEALRRFTQEIVARRGHLPPAEVQAFLDAGFSRQQLVEVLFGVGVKTFVHLVQNLADVLLDEPLASLRWTPAVS